MSPPAAAFDEARPHGAARALGAGVVVTLAAAAASVFGPQEYSGTLVGACFLAATWWFVLRRDEQTVRAFGLSLGGILEPSPISLRQIRHDIRRALPTLLLTMLVVFPPYWAGFCWYWHPSAAFQFRVPSAFLDSVMAQVIVVAFPEEAFFRGYLQTSLERSWPSRWRVLGVPFGMATIVASLVFALGHFLTIPNPGRLAVFFPALLFGWMRTKTGGIGASVFFHAACNLFSAIIQNGYGIR